MSHLHLCPQRDTPQKNIFQYKEIKTCSHVFLQKIAIAPPLTAPYDDPFKVIFKERQSHENPDERQGGNGLP